MWSRVAARGANLRRMSNANEDSEDARLTRGVVGSVMAESRRSASTRQEAGAAYSAPADDEDSDDEMVRELEREMVAQGSSEAPQESERDTLARLLEGVQRIEEAESMRTNDCRGL